MTYVDGFVLVVSKKNVKAYQKMAKMGGKIWKKYGAIEYYECMGDNFNPNISGFKKMVKLKEDETVWFSFIIYKSKKHRDQVNAKVMKDPFMNEDTWKDKPMPFDMKRFASAGFKVIVEEKNSS